MTNEFGGGGGEIERGNHKINLMDEFPTLPTNVRLHQITII